MLTINGYQYQLKNFNKISIAPLQEIAEQRIQQLYDRFNSNKITAHDLLRGLSFLCVNKRLNTKAHDSILTSHIKLIYFWNDFTYPLPGLILDRFGLQILPEIYHKIKWLDLESISMESILLASHYSNLYKLDLHLKIKYDNELIDGNHLEENIINYMPRLNKFIFNIRSFNYLPNLINLPSNEDIQYTFKDNKIISCVVYFKKRQYGLFKYVHKVSLYDEHPFEHEFFLQIAQSFPFMKKLTIS
ncbi:unnamed protein product [Rotaria sp. Silwood1]|nr:unnamed protein product [Rotaria sp. Silwood1]CAF1413555.1 unnamed protein product [Rotaria sp. Silwood1]CAF3551993.1 unnamed protein product [Rotaria sp. Silwood1]CAF4750382.1 unnamed protein product [Rotaria sp. Silwood1]CAF4797216.1 unnamed protein product [Rotaria sp. Silwood1]